jgi:hypothetical protein
MGFCDIPVAGKLCDAAATADFVSDPGKAIGDWIAKSCGELAAAAADLAAHAVSTTTKVDLNAGWFRDNYELILPIGLVVLVATFCAQLVRAAVRRDGQALTQAFTGTAMGVLFAFSAIALTTVAIDVVDALSDGLFTAAHTSVQDTVRRIVKVSDLGNLSQMGWMVPALAGLGSATGAFLFWCVMVVRKVGILVLVTLAVFAGAGGGWEVARRWRRGWIEATATLIVSKLLMTIIFLLGVSALGETKATDGLGALSDIMAGIVIMVLVLLCPYATFKFVHWAAEGTNGEDLHRSGGAGMQVARQHAERAGRKAAAMAATGRAGGAGAAPQGPPSVPGQGQGGITAANPTGPSANDRSQDSGTTAAPGANAPVKTLQPAGGTPGGGDSAPPPDGPSDTGSATSTGAWAVQTSTAPPPQGPAATPDTASATGPIPPPPPAGT